MCACAAILQSSSRGLPVDTLTKLFGPFAVELVVRRHPTGNGLRVRIPAELCLVLSVLVACAGSKRVPEPSPGEWLVLGLGDQIEGAVGRTPADLLQRWGEPDSVRQRPFDNLHVEGQIDTVATYWFDGLEASYYRISANGRELPLNYSIGRPGYLSGLPVDVGSTVSQVRGALGSAQETTDGQHRYEDEYVILLLSINAGQVDSITYIPYVD